MIETERVELRPYTREDAEAVVARNRVGRAWADGFPREDDVDVARVFLSLPEGHDPEFGPYLMVLRSSGLVIGTLGFLGPPDETGTLEFGYGIAPEFEGRGLTTEAVRALLATALGLPGVRRVVAETTRANIGSQRVMEKAGMNRMSAADAEVRYAIEAAEGR